MTIVGTGELVVSDLCRKKKKGGMRIMSCGIRRMSDARKQLDIIGRDVMKTKYASGKEWPFWLFYAPPPEKAESMDGAQLSTVAFSRNLRAAGTNLDENIFWTGK